MANTEAAAKEKELGNAAYKKKDFPTAIAHYKKVRITEKFIYTWLWFRILSHLYP